MIRKVIITDSKNLPLRYARDLESFKNGKEYEFKPGINIIVGNNGCGKTTLIKMIASYMLCENKMCTELPNFSVIGDCLKIENIFRGEELKDGMKVESDYAGVVYNYITHKDLTNDEILSSPEKASMYIDNSSASTGESMVSSLGYLLNMAFSNKNIQFPINEIIELSKKSNDIWSKRFKSLLKYYKENSIQVSMEDFEFTFLLDEPDRNLDLDNIDSIYNILSYRKENTQLLCVIHNPILIYKLSKLPYINFVEMTDGYVDKVKGVFSKL